MVALSAEFSVNGSSSASIAHSVAYGATVTLALLSTSGANSISWSVDGVSHASMTAPVITAAGSPVGATATFVMPADPGDIQGRAVRIKALITDSANTQSVAYRVIGVPNSYGLIPGTAGEELARHPTMGWTELFNGAMARGVPALVNPTDDGKFPYGSAGAYVLTSTVKVANAGASLTFGASPAGSGALRFSADSTLNVLLNNGNTVAALSQEASRFAYGSTDAALQGIDIRAGAAAATLQVHLGGSNAAQFGASYLALQFGTNTAASGAVRLGNAHVLAWRNFGNTGDITGIQVFTDNTVLIGDAANAGLRYNTATGGTHVWRVNSVTELSLDSTALYLQDNALIFGATPAAAGIIRGTDGFEVQVKIGGTDRNVILASNSVAGIIFGAAGITNQVNGDPLYIRNGSGQHASIGTNAWAIMAPTAAVSFSVTGAAAVTSNAWTIRGQDNTGATATHTAGAVTLAAGDATGAGFTHVGGALTLRGGDATGGTGTRTGGGLDLRAGTGATANGSLRLLNGATVRLEINATGVGFFAVAPVARQAVAALTSAFGTGNDALVDVGAAFSQTVLNDNFRDCVTKIEQIRTALVNYGLLS